MANIQARGADHTKLEALNVQVLAISSDSTFALKTQSDSLKLPYPLLSDRPPKTIQRYGVMAPDNVRALRAFFLIDEQGRIAHVIDDVNTKDHARQVLALL